MARVNTLLYSVYHHEFHWLIDTKTKHDHVFHLGMPCIPLLSKKIRDHYLVDIEFADVDL